MARVVNLRSLRLRSGEQHRDEYDVPLEPFELGGQRYLPVPDTAAAELAVTRASSGMVLELSFPVRLHGPCFRCLEEAALDLRIRGREYQALSPDADEELRSPYVDDERLDLAGWARDATALKLPEQILCRADCAGLCAICGRNLNDEPHEHETEATDPRWAALADLRDRL
ncbi:MAG: DUF177 domain-containing protein [Actinomycetota bacterium]|nr:DUF177 domain-containing protein [Actinomycetota bacterium]